MALYKWEPINNSLLNVSLSDGGLAIATAAADVKTTATVTFCANGIFATKTAGDIDLSATTAGDEIILDGETKDIVLVVNAAGTIDALLNKDNGWSIPSDKACFGKVTVANASGADFIIGTTLLSAAGITDTYYDLCRYNG